MTRHDWENFFAMISIDKANAVAVVIEVSGMLLALSVEAAWLAFVTYGLSVVVAAVVYDRMKRWSK